MRARRILTLLTAYLCASAVGGLVLTLPLLTWYFQSATDFEWTSLVGAAELLSLYCGLVAVFALPASLVMIVIGEMKRITSPLAHALVGAAIGPIGVLLLAFVTSPLQINPVGMLQDSPISFTLGLFLPLSLVAGACAGLMFWFIASRLPQHMPTAGVSHG